MQFRNLFKSRLGTVALMGSVGAICVAVVFDWPAYYDRPGIKDYDQKRNSLPADGAMYCVPTSYVDQFRYLASAGLSGMDASYTNTYPDTSAFIALMGQLMGTTPEGGTNFEVGFDIGTQWINNHTGQLVYNTYYGADWDWGAGTIRNSVASGSINVMAYGKYFKHNDSWYRDGGHCIALTGYDWRNSTKKWIVSDPASTWNDTLGINGQGDYKHDLKNTSSITLTTEDYGVVTHARYTFYTGEPDEYTPKRRVIDSLHQISPVWAGWYETNINTSVNANDMADGSVKTIIPLQLEGHTFVPAEVVPREDMVDWVYDIGQAAVFYVTRLGRIYYVDLTTGEDKLIHVVKGAKSLMVGGTTNDLFVLVTGHPNDTIWRFERDDMHLDHDQTPDSPRRVSKPLPGHGLGLEYDPITGGPAILSAGLDVAWEFDENLVSKPNLALPTLDPGTGKVIFRIDHNTGDVIMAREGDFSFRRASRRGTEVYNNTLRLVHGITTIVPTESDCILVQDGDTLQTFNRDGSIRETQLSNVVVGGTVKMARSHFAGKRGTMVGPKWRNIDPDELGD